MRCSRLVFVIIISAGCGAGQTQPTPVPTPVPTLLPTLLPTFTVSGIVVSTSSAQPVSAASVEVNGVGSDGLARKVTVETGADGIYTAAGLRGNVSVRVAKDGFYPLASTIALERNGTLDFRLETAAPIAKEGDDLFVGQPISGTIGGTDSRCDRQWDANSPCRIYGFTPKITRQFTFFMRLFSCGEMELHVIDQTGTRVGYGDSTGFLTVDASLMAGREYEIRLMAYYRCDLFELTVK